MHFYDNVKSLLNYKDGETVEIFLRLFFIVENFFANFFSTKKIAPASTVNDT